MHLKKGTKDRIIVIFPRGEALRNFAYTGILNELRREFEVILMSIIPNEHLRIYLESQCDRFIEIEEAPLPYYSAFIHEIMDLAHNRYLWSEAARVRWEMRDVEAKGLIKNIFRLSKKLIAILCANNFCIRRLEELDILFSRNNPGVSKYRKLIKNLDPDLIFNSSHIHGKVAYPIIQAARLEKIKTATFLFSWDNLTSQGRVIPPYDTYLAWNENIKNDLLRIYPSLKSSQVIVTGTPQFSFHFNPEYHKSRSTFLEELGLQPHEKYVLYSSGMSNHMPYEPEVAEALADILKDIDPHLKLVIRTYAKDRDDVFEDLKQRRKDIIIPEVKWEKNYFTPLREDQAFFTNLLLHCEMGVNVASTISLELCMLDKPAINIGFNPPGRDIYPYDYTRFYQFDHYKPVVESGAISVAKNLQELKKMIQEYLKNPKLNAGKRAALIDQFFGGRHRGSANDEIVKEIAKLINSSDVVKDGLSIPVS